jgi:S-DNA-T family DNA segregation ATPase FtsK/SpoIIIE
LFNLIPNFSKNKEKQSKTKKEIQEKKQFQKEKLEFEQKFYRLMLELGLYNKFNRTYWLRIIERTDYGFYAQLYLEDGLSFNDIKQKIGNIQESLCCIWIMKTKQFQKYADVQIVTEPMDENIPFEPPKIKPYEMYIGMSFSLKPIIINMHDYCMYLMAGATGSGKTILIYQILLSWITSCTPQEVEIYLGDIAKNEYVNFEHVKHVKFYASELEQLDKMISILLKEFERRKKILSITRTKGIATGIREYNQISKNKLSTIIILQDEFSVILPDKTDNKEEKEMKQRIIDGLKFLSKTGRNLGMYTFEALQKTVKEEIPSIIKSQSAVRISLRANDSISSEVIMGDHSAVGLGKRYAVYSLNGGEEQNYLYSPYLDTKMLNKMLEPYIDEKFKIKKSVVKKKIFDPNVVEINTKLKEVPKNSGFEYIETPRQETKVIQLKGGDYIDY